MNHCPFCGSTTTVAVHLMLGPEWTGHAMECSACGARGPVCVKRAEAVERWNQATKGGEK